MLEFIIEVSPHPYYKDMQVTWLKWELPNCISRINIELPQNEVEETLLKYLGHEIDNLSYLIALKMIRNWKKEHPTRARKENEIITRRETTRYEA